MECMFDIVWIRPSSPSTFRIRGLCGAQSARCRREARGMATSSDNLIAFGQRHVTAGIGRLTEAVMSKGEGSYLSFEDGRRILDFSSGIGVTNLGKWVVFALFRNAWPTSSLHRGHCHPKISKAAADQCTSLVHGQVIPCLTTFPCNLIILQCSIAFHLPYLRLIEKLLPLMPDPSLDSFYFWNSGSEAIEATLKMARSITGRQNIISMQGMRSAWPGLLPCSCITHLAPP